MSSTLRADADAARAPAEPRPARRSAPRTRLVPTVLLLIGAFYCLMPVMWVVIAATKGPNDLFTTFSFWPRFNGGFAYNVTHLLDFRGGIFWKWALNSLLYAGVGGLLSVVVSVTAGYGLAKYRFPGREPIFRCILAGVLVPQITLAVPQYLLMSKLGLVNSYWSVLLSSIISFYGIYLSRIYASAVIADDMLEAGRIDGAGEYRLAWSIGLPPMIPGMVTIFLLQFVAIWNNFLLPYIMISDDRHFPMTVGLFSLLNQGASQPALYSLAIMGAFLSILPLIALFLFLQRYWRIDLVSGGIKG